MYTVIFRYLTIHVWFMTFIFYFYGNRFVKHGIDRVPKRLIWFLPFRVWAKMTLRNLYAYEFLNFMSKHFPAHALKTYCFERGRVNKFRQKMRKIWERVLGKIRVMKRWSGHWSYGSKNSSRYDVFFKKQFLLNFVKITCYNIIKVSLVTK